MIEIARILNPSIDTVVRTHSEEEAELFRQEGVGKVFMGEHELARGGGCVVPGAVDLVVTVGNSPLVIHTCHCARSYTRRMASALVKWQLKKTGARLRALRAELQVIDEQRMYLVDDADDLVFCASNIGK